MTRHSQSYQQPPTRALEIHWWNSIDAWVSVLLIDYSGFFYCFSDIPLEKTIVIPKQSQNSSFCKSLAIGKYSRSYLERTQYCISYREKQLLSLCQTSKFVLLCWKQCREKDTDLWPDTFRDIQNTQYFHSAVFYWHWQKVSNVLTSTSQYILRLQKMLSFIKIYVPCFPWIQQNLCVLVKQQQS